jgi:hypothetical protein
VKLCGRGSERQQSQGIDAPDRRSRSFVRRARQRRYDRELDRSDLVVLDASDFGGDPVAVVQLPRRVPFGIHGSWLAG